MRIPLDYYRILGLPIQATAEQLSQAYRDRALQLPRREYSEAAIASRKQLLDEAYAVLSDPEQRSAYDASFLAKTYEQQPGQPISLGTTSPSEGTDSPVDPHNPSIEIKNEQFVGALLIFQELGEYELVLQLGQPYLGAREGISLDKGRLGDPQLVRPDIVLTLALACMELGREQWQQGQYENAATSLEMGQELLLREGIFPSVRGEIQADLYKLRPYRILELLALPEENIVERRNGMRLLQDMLQERMGIDGTGDDQSGLSIDDFLRFIQQLRGYLSAAEQQNLFESEAKRPSAVATYLAVYALIARGFAQRQPALIARAKQMLIRLGRRQDVHLEQAVCALLLGQTEEASRALELSQEYEPLAFIREHSQGSPDLLPGLCLYGERWLQKSVFPHFRDLADQKTSLKEYFADEQVQAYLENLPESSGDPNNEWAVVQSQKATYATGASSRSASESTPFRQSDAYQPYSESRSRSGEAQQQADSALSHSVSKPTVVGSQWGSSREAAATAISRAATLGATTERAPTHSVSTLPATQRISRSSTNGDSTATGTPGDSSVKSGRRQRPSRGGSEASTTRLQSTDSVAGASSSAGESLKRLPAGRGHTSQEKSKSGLRPGSQTAKVRRLVLLAIVGLVGLLVLGWMVTKTLSWLQKGSAPALEGTQPRISLDKPPIPIPEEGSKMLTPEGPMTEESAQQLVQNWLSVKASALGSEHQVAQLEQVLVEPVLSSWRGRAESTKRDNSYWQYEHAVKVNSVDTSPANPERARVDAAVKENAKLYKGGQLDRASSYDENLRVRYELMRKNGRWFIQNMAVVK